MFVFAVPILVLGKMYYDLLILWLKYVMVKEKTINREDLDLIIVVDSVKEITSKF